MRYIKGLSAFIIALGFVSYFYTANYADPLKGQKTNLHGPQFVNDKKIAAGINAMDFSALDSKGHTVKLSDFKGKKNVLLIFYPGDNTPGCTRQLNALRDEYKGLDKLNIKIFGVNQANAESHNKFISDQKLPFELIVDQDSKISTAYDAMGMLGFINRTVVLINKEGKIVLYERGMPDINPKTVVKLL
jgi:peroxiredoxin Q/BCP